MAGACMDEFRNVYKVLAGKLAGKSSLGRHGRKCENNLKNVLTYIGYESVKRIHLTQGRNQWLSNTETVVSRGPSRLNQVLKELSQVGCYLKYHACHTVIIRDISCHEFADYRADCLTGD